MSGIGAAEPSRREQLLSGARSGGMPDMSAMMAGLPGGTIGEGSRETSQSPAPGGGSQDMTATLHELGIQRERGDSRIERMLAGASARADREHNEELLEKNTNKATDAIKEAYAGMRSYNPDSQAIGVGTSGSGANPMHANLGMQEQMALLSVKLQAAGFASPEGQSGAYQQYGYRPTEVAVDLAKADMSRNIT